MASTTGPQRPSIILSVITLVVMVVVALLVFRWIAGLLATLIQLGLVLVALFILARIGLYLLRKGGSA